MKKYNFKVGSFLCYIALSLFAFMFAVDAVLSIAGMASAGETAVPAFAVTISLVEMLICVAVCGLLVYAADFRFKRSYGLFNLKPFVNISIVAAYLIVTLVSIIAMAWAKVADGSLITIIVFLILIGLLNFFSFVFQDKLTALGEKVADTAVDAINFIMVIVLLATVFSGSAGGIIIGIFSIIGLILALTYDIINLVKPSLLDLPISLTKKGVRAVPSATEEKTVAPEEAGEASSLKETEASSDQAEEESDKGE